MRASSWRRDASGDSSDQGAVLVELAIVGLLVFTLIFAIIEFGLLYRDYLSASDATGDASRIGAIRGPNVGPSGESADYYIVKSLRENLAGIPVDSIDRLVIFKARGSNAGRPEDQAPAACRAGHAVPGRCNVYSAREAFLHVQDGQADYFDCEKNSGGPSCSWKPTSRSDGPKPSDVEYVGVYIHVKHSAVTGFFADGYSLTAASVSRLEPGISE